MALAVVSFLVLRTQALETFLSLQTIPSVDNSLVNLEGTEYLATALAIAAAALFMLVSSDSPPPVASKPPGAEIDAASRAKLERVLEESETRGDG